jgi:Zn-dependent M28 family amino/carboxypeptidase
LGVSQPGDERDRDAAALRDRLLSDLSELVHERDPDSAPAGHAHVKSYVARRLAQRGPIRRHEFQFQTRTHHNLVLDLPGRQDRPLILVGAHYDTVPGSPGADDNGTGLAVLLELARAFSIEPARSPIRLVAFDLEEREQTGSRAYADEVRRRREPVRLMISLEMLGYRDTRPGSQRYPPVLRHLYPDRGDFIGLIGNMRALPCLRRLARSMRELVPCEWLVVPARGRVLPDTRRSDHAPFWDLGYPAIMITDTADMRNPHYHTASDRIETLDLDFLAGVCAGLVRGLSEL